MSSDFTIRTMSRDDLRLAAGWATAEGWNPGLADAEAFHSVDPDGFLMGWLGDTPVSAISVVRHSDDFGFLGFYLCQPEFRGKGYGWATWQAGVAHLGDRTIGLDGVPAQQANYERSGFTFAHNTQRYAGRVEGRAAPDCRPPMPGDLPELLSMDLQISNASRVAYLSAWVQQTPNRQTLICSAGGKTVGFGTIRTCQEGHKLGPLFAADAAIAKRLLHALVKSARADEIMIDVPDPNSAGVEMANDLELQPIFSCARMYRGGAPARLLGQIFGETTFELG